MRLSISIDGLDGLDAALETLKEDLMPRVAKGINQGAAVIVADAKRIVHVDSGQLHDSIVVIPAEISGKVASGGVEATADHAVYEEMGTGARGAASGGNGSGVSVTYTPDHPGMAAHPYLFPAYKNNQQQVVDAVAKAVKGG